MSYKPIKGDDPQAVEKLQAKLETYEKKQAYMKDVNAYFRKHDTCRGYPGMSDEQAAKIDEAVFTGQSWDRQPFSSYHLKNNNAEIRRIKNRIEELTRKQEIGFVGWEFPGGTAEINTDIDRLQLFFDEKPDEEKRYYLKLNGFKWAPSEGAWQRQLNENAIAAASRMKFLYPESGESPWSLQPKAPSKSSPER